MKRKQAAGNEGLQEKERFYYKKMTNEKEKTDKQEYPWRKIIKISSLWRLLIQTPLRGDISQLILYMADEHANMHAYKYVKQHIR